MPKDHDVLFRLSDWKSLRDQILLAVLKSRAGEALTETENELLREGAESYVAMLRPILD